MVLSDGCLPGTDSVTFYITFCDPAPVFSTELCQLVKYTMWLDDLLDLSVVYLATGKSNVLSRNWGMGLTVL